VSTRNEHLILSAAIAGSGYHPGAAARLPQVLDIAYFRHLVQTAERGLLDFVFLHDERALPDAAVTGHLDALSVLARLAPETTCVGLAVSVPTTYSEPFNVSRALATLDFVSGGRAAWNATSAASDAEAHNFGKKYAPDADERRAIAEEFIEVSRSSGTAGRTTQSSPTASAVCTLTLRSCTTLTTSGRTFRFAGRRLPTAHRKGTR
jgi:alkanesulfonate monooxygenase SsuD/methylene tetrahydromethanopterin reductase-like flavin-dependent oxidoreductase (luciferase family)